MSLRSIRPPTIDELMAGAPHKTLEDVVAEAFAGMKPAAQMSVVEAAEAYTKIGAAAGRSAPWSRARTPYLVEPMNVLTSLDFTGMTFVGPARTGKTLMGLGWISHTVKSDPADMLFVNMDRSNARKWSKGDLDRYLKASPEIRALQNTRRDADNTFDKTFKNGMQILLTYPTASNLSQLTVGKVMLNDYDRMDDNVDGEGNPYDLASMRTTTFKRFAMTAAESSPNPNKEIQDPRWISPSPHAAPPIRGIFELYNRGDRRLLYCPCPECGEFFELDFKHLRWPQKADIMEAREQTWMQCPVHGCRITPGKKEQMVALGVWLKDGQAISSDGEITVRPGMMVARSTIASFWLKGPAAAYQVWGQLVEKYLRAMKALEETGDDGPLRKTVTTDQGTFYVAPSRLSDMTPEDLMHRAEDWGSEETTPTVPDGVRFLIATVDVQNAAFVVQITGVTDTLDLVVVDAFKIRASARLNERGENLPIEPHTYGSDWDQLETEVMQRTYLLADGSGRRMQIRATGCDSGGREGVTVHAYAFWRRLKEGADGSHQRFVLVKGEPRRSAPMAHTTWPDSSQKDKFATARGDVPVLLLNPNTLKDAVHLMLTRRAAPPEEAAGQVGGMIRFPDWLPNWFYVQMTTEIRTEKGWENPRARRNESFDLTYYALGIIYRPSERGVPFVHFGLDRINRDDPPDWFLPWDRNPLVLSPTGQSSSPGVKKRLSIEELAKKLA